MDKITKYKLFFLIVRLSEEWWESKIFEKLESHISTNEDVEYHDRDDAIRIWNEKILEFFVLKEEVNPPCDDDILKEIYKPNSSSELDIILKDLISKNHGNKYRKNDKIIIKKWVVDYLKLKKVIYPDKKKEENYIETN